MLKRFFDWTARDITYWEKIRQKGVKNFILWYGVVISGGILFLVFGTVTFFGWLRQMSSIKVTPTSMIFLAWQLIIVALVCLAGGVINSLITWVVEERMYRKYKARR